jgi:hypothetical protein
MRAEEIKGLIEAYSKVHETPEVLSEVAKPNPNDLGYRAGRGIMGALSDLGPGLAGQLTGKDNPALQRQRARAQKLQQLVTTGKLDAPTSAARPTRQNPAVQNQIAKNEKDRRTMNPDDYFGTKQEKPKPSPGPGSNRPSPGGTPSGSPGGTPSNVVSAKNIAGQSQKVTVGRKYGATLGGQKGSVTYDAAGKRTFTADKPSTAADKPTTPSTPSAKPSAMDQWAKANPKLAAVAAEKARIRGTQQTDNPLMKDMRSRLPMNSPSVQSPAVAKLGAGNQSLVNNPNAFKAAPPKPVNTKPTPGSGFNDKASAPPEDLIKKTAAVAATSTPKPVQPMKKETTDIFDLVKGHLLDEGYAETEENALVMMANMSEEWRETIIMELTGGKGHPGYKAGSKDHGPMEAGHPADSEKRKDKGGTMSMRHGYHLGDMDDEDDDDDLESVVKQQSRDSRERVRKPLRDKVKAARKKMTKEEVDINEKMEKWIQKVIDESSKTDDGTRARIKMFAGKKGIEFEPGPRWDPSANRGKGANLSPKQMEKQRRKKLRQEDLEAWVDELIAEGYDLSEYTWEEVAEIYAQELELSEAQRARENPEGHDKEEKRKYEPVRGEKTPMPPRGDKRREDFEKWYRANVR